MPRARQKPNRARNTLLAILLVVGAVAALRHGKAIDLTAADIRIGHGSSDRRNWTDKPFSIGHPDRYRKDGINFDYARSHGVYIVTNRGMVVALSAESPATGKMPRYETVNGQFADPHNGDRFTTDGLLRGQKRDQRRFLDDEAAVRAALAEGKSFSRSLERCHIKLKGSYDSDDAELIVDPRHRHLFELNQWSHAFSAWVFPK